MELAVRELLCELLALLIGRVERVVQHLGRRPRIEILSRGRLCRLLPSIVLGLDPRHGLGVPLLCQLASRFLTESFPILLLLLFLNTVLLLFLLGPHVRVVEGRGMGRAAARTHGSGGVHKEALLLTSRLLQVLLVLGGRVLPAALLILLCELWQWQWQWRPMVPEPAATAVRLSRHVAYALRRRAARLARQLLLLLLFLLGRHSHNAGHTEQVEPPVNGLVAKAVEHVATLLRKHKLLALQACFDALLKMHFCQVPRCAHRFLGTEARLAEIIAMKERHSVIIVALLRRRSGNW
mmetsp:Transcript_23853/g.59123  ORF Transcript_23853/g.59123 Transcript_23853/m.59123 type:complete len:295 (+) Transcript_23853:675-1559(+)